MSTAPTPTRSEPAQRRGAVPRILIVDDEQSMREWMRILFQRDGFEVVVAEDGLVARDLIGRDAGNNSKGSTHATSHTGHRPR